MEAKKLKLIGLLLILAGLVGVGVTAVALNGIYTRETFDLASALAEAISGKLVPATVGILLALAGVILVLSGWWRERQGKQPNGLEGA